MHEVVMERLKNCPLCACGMPLDLWTIEKRGAEISVGKCSSCGLVFQNPRPSDPDKIYDADYYSGKKLYSYTRDSAVDLPIWEARMRRLEAGLGENKARRILDVGCATGDLLLAASRRGWESWGVDVSAHAAGKTSAKVKNAKILTGDVFLSVLPENYFDVVTLFEVLEHVADPVPFLSRVCRLLAPGGIVVIQTANINSLKGKLQGRNFYYFEPGHLIYYSVDTLRLLLEKSGLQEIGLWMGSELDIATELRVFAAYYSRVYILAKRIFNKIFFGGFTLGTVMVAYARKKQ